ncbi:MAG: response regulator [Candidatus Omnitrophica bacterium]|nr:response regulator [Candidatus Omnitrophota bacterium]
MINILIIDDEKDCCRMVKEYLEGLGCHVDAVYSGEQGLAYVSLKMPDIVILDNKMGGMSGVDVLRRLKEIKKELVVIMVTVDIASQKIAREYAVDGYIQKPFDVYALRDMILSKIGTIIERKKGT